MYSSRAKGDTNKFTTEERQATKKTIMKKSERAQIVQSRLDSLYPETPIPLDHTDTYTLLVSVLLSAQCTDKMVNRVTPSLWKLANNPLDMSMQSVESIREIIKPCGLSPQKSKAIKGLSSMLVLEHSGKVPESFEALERLPGVIIDRRNNNLSLNGQNGVSVLINGKAVRLSVNEIVAMLNGMAGDNIEKIELMTSPTAQYDADCPAPGRRYCPRSGWRYAADLHG